MKLTTSNLFKFVRLLSVEPLGFLTFFIHIFKRNAVDQMIQDKLCLQRYNLPLGYCQALPTMKDVEDNFRLKSTILADVTEFQMYINIFLTAPLFVISLMIGPFIDKYRPAKRVLFIYTSVIYLLASISYLISSFWFWLDYRLLILSSAILAFSAGPVIGITCLWAYLSAVTPGHLRSMRLMIMEVVMAMSPPIAIALGGNLLDLRPLFPFREPRNYSAIFLISIFASLIFLVLSILLLNEDKDKLLFGQYFPRESHHRHSMIPSTPTRLEPAEEEEAEKSPIAILLDFRNAKEMFKTFTKKRRYGIRSQIILLVAAKVIGHFASYGPHTFMYQYVQKVFSWNVSQYSNYVTGSNVINIVSTFALGPVIVNILKVADLHYAILGYSMMLIQNFLRLASTALWAFYAALPFHALNALSTVGIQAYITKVTERSEVGRIFSLMGMFDSLVPLLSSLIFSNIFASTIDSHPNLSFLAVVLGLVTAITLNGIVAWKSRDTLDLIESEQKSEEARKMKLELDDDVEFSVKL